MCHAHEVSFQRSIVGFLYTGFHNFFMIFIIIRFCNLFFLRDVSNLRTSLSWKLFHLMPHTAHRGYIFYCTSKLPACWLYNIFLRAGEWVNATTAAIHEDKVDVWMGLGRDCNSYIFFHYSHFGFSYVLYPWESWCGYMYWHICLECHTNSVTYYNHRHQDVKICAGKEVKKNLSVDKLASDLKL